MADDGQHNRRRLPRQRFSTAMRRRSPLFGYRMARVAACGGAPIARAIGAAGLRCGRRRPARWRGNPEPFSDPRAGKTLAVRTGVRTVGFLFRRDARCPSGNAGFSHSGQPGPVTEARNRVVTASRSPRARGPVRERNILRFRQRGGAQGLKKKIFQTNRVCLKQIFSGAPPDIFAVRLPNSSRFPHL